MVQPFLISEQSGRCVRLNYVLRQAKTALKMFDKLPHERPVYGAATEVIQDLDVFLEGSCNASDIDWIRFVITFFIAEIIGG